MFPTQETALILTHLQKSLIMKRGRFLRLESDRYLLVAGSLPWNRKILRLPRCLRGQSRMDRIQTQAPLARVWTKDHPQQHLVTCGSSWVVDFWLLRGRPTCSRSTMAYYVSTRTAWWPCTTLLDKSNGLDFSKLALEFGHFSSNSETDDTMYISIFHFDLSSHINAARKQNFKGRKKRLIPQSRIKPRTLNLRMNILPLKLPKSNVFMWNPELIAWSIHTNSPGLHRMIWVLVV